MERHTFTWASRSSRQRRSPDATLRRCYDELSVIADRAASATAAEDWGDGSPPIRRPRRAGR